MSIQYTYTALIQNVQRLLNHHPKREFGDRPFSIFSYNDSSKLKLAPLWMQGQDFNHFMEKWPLKVQKLPCMNIKQLKKTISGP
jgi:hypothetical protein